MAKDHAALEQPGKRRMSDSQMVDPDRGVDEDHEGSLRRLGTSTSSGALPPSFARRRALSRWIRARSASRTSAVFPLVPVSRCASVSYTHLRAHETDSYLVCRLLLEK